MLNHTEEAPKKYLDIRIRQATLEDSKFLADNTASMAFETENKRCNMTQIYKFMPPAIERDSEILYFIASANGQDIGSCGGTFESNISDTKRYLWYHCVYVK